MWVPAVEGAYGDPKEKAEREQLVSEFTPQPTFARTQSTRHLHNPSLYTVNSIKIHNQRLSHKQKWLTRTSVRRASCHLEGRLA